MHPRKAYYKQLNERIEKEKKVVKISNLIQKILGFTEVPRDFVCELGHYKIVTTSRLFDDGWVSIFEIVRASDDNVGYTNVSNPYWIVVEGTRTVNLPPAAVVENVVKALKKVCAE